MNTTHYDIIGDIHGQVNKLVNLLKNLGYQLQDDVYQKKHHQVIFVGDFIDRGLQEKEVLSIVRAMIDSGHAQAVMGNHEFNAICYHTQNEQGDYLRPHTKSHTKQHQAFLDEYPLAAIETNEIITWFKTLPLFLEFDNFRVIHACWDEGLIALIKPQLTQNNCLKSEHYPLACKKNSFFYTTIETLLKGFELALPTGNVFIDKNGITRHRIRVKWWQKNWQTYQQAAVTFETTHNKLPDIPIPDKININFYPKSAIPIFFGHYWLSGTPKILNHNVVCLDYSAATTGALIGYRLINSSQKQSLNNKNFYQSHT